MVTSSSIFEHEDGSAGSETRDKGPWQRVRALASLLLRIGTHEARRTMAVRSRIEREIGDLEHVHDATIVTTCYLDVDGGHRPRRDDYMQAFKALAQNARESSDVEEPEVRTALDGNLAMLDRWHGEIVGALGRIGAGSGLVEPAAVSTVCAWHGAGAQA